MTLDPRLIAAAKRLSEEPIFAHYRIHEIISPPDVTTFTQSLEEFLPGERWIPLPRFEGVYEISDYGRVRSLERRVYTDGPHGKITERLYRTKILRTCVSDGYPQVRLCRQISATKSEQKNLRIHRLVLIAFRGPRPKGLCACHNNGISTDCRLSNLRWDTYGSNVADRLKHAEEKRARAERAFHVAA